MSKQVLRVQKIKSAGAVSGLEIHNERQREHSNSNPDIDFSRSGDNYSLTEPSGLSYNDRIAERLKTGYTGHKAVRKDAVKLVEVIVTSDEEFFKKLDKTSQRAFFVDCVDFLSEKFGKDNIISANVHMDERTPHMHLDFVPLTKDGRLSAKEVCGDRKDLQALQDSFYKQVGKKYGLERGSRADIDKGERGRKHLETERYKALAVKKEVEKLENKKIGVKGLIKKVSYKDFEELQEKLVHARDVLKKAKEQMSSMQSRNRGLEEKIQIMSEKLERAEKICKAIDNLGLTEELEREIKRIEKQEKIEKEGGFRMSAEDWKKLVRSRTSQEPQMQREHHRNKNHEFER